MQRPVNKNGQNIVPQAQGLLSGSNPSFSVRFAQNDADIAAVQRLRYRVFVTELGGDGPLVDHAQGLEIDVFDPVSRHLMLLDRGRTVGAYRLLDRCGAERLGRFYSEAEFDLTCLLESHRNVLELGRSCVETAYRKGPALLHLWHGLGRYVMAHDIGLLFGVASFHGTDTCALAAPLSLLHHHHRAPEHLRPIAKPEGRADMALIDAAVLDRKSALQQMPPLIKSYLKLGGGVGQGAFVDRAFNTVDVALVVDVDGMPDRQKQQYAKELPA